MQEANQPKTTVPAKKSTLGSGFIVSIVAIVVFIIIGVVMALFGINYRNSQVAPADRQFQGCEYGTKIYDHNETFPAGDSCNSCSCNDGRVMCTLISCNPDALNNE